MGIAGYAVWCGGDVCLRLGDLVVGPGVVGPAVGVIKPVYNGTPLGRAT